MDFYVMTLFPQMITDAVSHSITGRASAKGLINVVPVDIRDYTTEKHGKTDDYPYGGGAGMVMQVQPVHDCYKAVLGMIEERHQQKSGGDALTDKAACDGNAESSSVPNSDNDAGCADCIEVLSVTNPDNGAADMAADISMQPDTGEDTCTADSVMHGAEHRKPRVLYMSPQGRVFDQHFAAELAKEDELVFLCGHYEGIDERALELLDVEEVSLGDFILTGGELPAVTMIDCISRLIPGVLGSSDSAEIESFHDNLLEYPQYSRPEDYMGMKVPDILLSGHHANVEKWRREQSIIRTLDKRPDLIDAAVLSKKEQRFLNELLKERRSHDGQAGMQASQPGIRA